MTSGCLLPGDEVRFELLGPNGRVTAVAGPPIGTGRVASVFGVADPPNARSLVLKLFHERKVPEHTSDIIKFADERGLDEVTPMGLGDHDAFPMIAAPKCLVFAEKGKTPVGIAALRIDDGRFRPLTEVLNGTRLIADLSLATRLAMQLSDLVQQIHARDFVIGDISGTNLMADDEGFCCIVDVDSFGVIADDDQPGISAAFATANYMAPGLADGHATKTSDRFILGCLLLQLLCQGLHPFGGVPADGEGGSIQENINAGRSWLFDRSAIILPPPYGTFMSSEVLPRRISQLAHSALRTDQPPTAKQWTEELRLLLDQIRFCEDCGEKTFVDGACWRCGLGTSGPLQVLPDEVWLSEEIAPNDEKDQKRRRWGRRKQKDE